MRQNAYHRIISLLLTLCLFIGLLPAVALPVLAGEEQYYAGAIRAMLFESGENGAGLSSIGARDAGCLLLDFGNSNRWGLTENTVIEYIIIIDPASSSFTYQYGMNLWHKPFTDPSSGETYSSLNGTFVNKLFLNGQWNGVLRLDDFIPDYINGGMPDGNYYIEVTGYNPASGGGDPTLFRFRSSNTIRVNAAPVQAPLAITTDNSKPFYLKRGEPFELQLTANRDETLTWGVAPRGGFRGFPGGIGIDDSTGKISGTPNASGCSWWYDDEYGVRVGEAWQGGTFTATVYIRGSNGSYAEKEFTFVIGEFALFQLDGITAEMQDIFENHSGWLYITGDVFDYLGDGKVYTLTLTYLSGNSLHDGQKLRPFGYYPGKTVSNLRVVLVKGDEPGTSLDRVYTIGYYPGPVELADDTVTRIRVGSLTPSVFHFFLPDDLDPNAYGQRVDLTAGSGSDKIYLWSGTLTEGMKSIPVTNYVDQSFSDVELTTYVYGSAGAVVLAAHPGRKLDAGQGAELSSAGRVLTRLPLVENDTYSSVAEIKTRYEKNGYSYSPGDLADYRGTYTLKTTVRYSAYLNEGCDPESPIYSGSGVSKSGGEYTYTPADDSSAGADALALTFFKPQTLAYGGTLTKATDLQESDPDLEGATLTFSQNAYGRHLYQSVTVGEGNTFTGVDLYPGKEYTAFLAGSAYDVFHNEEFIAPSDAAIPIGLQVYGPDEQDAAVLVTPRLRNDNAALKEYAALLNPLLGMRAKLSTGGSAYTPGYIWPVSPTAQSVRLFSGWYDSSAVVRLIQNGGSVDLTWGDADAAIKQETPVTVSWPQDARTIATELTVNLRGGVLVPVNYTGASHFSVQGWWHKVEDGKDVWKSWGNSFRIMPGENTLAFYCGWEPGTYDFIALANSCYPVGMTWDAVVNAWGKNASESPITPYQASVTVANNEVTTLPLLTISQKESDSALYATKPLSFIQGPASFAGKDDLLTFTGHIQADADLGDRKITRLVINQSNCWISSVVIGGRRYAFAGDAMSLTLPDDTLRTYWNLYYDIPFSEDNRVSLPCEFTIYAKPYNVAEPVSVSVSVDLDGSGGYYRQPVGQVVVAQPTVSVLASDVVGTDSAWVRLIIPGGRKVDVYSSGVLVRSGVSSELLRNDLIEVPLFGARNDQITLHELSFRWADGADKGQEAGSLTLTHAKGAPTLQEYYLQPGWLDENDQFLYNNVAPGTRYFIMFTPDKYRIEATVRNPENLKDGKISFAVRYSNGTQILAKGSRVGSTDTFYSELLPGDSTVCNVEVLYETDWSKVQEVMDDNKNDAVEGSYAAKMEYSGIPTTVYTKEAFQKEVPVTGASGAELAKYNAARDKVSTDILKAYTQNASAAAAYQAIPHDPAGVYYTGLYALVDISPTGLADGAVCDSSYAREISQNEFEAAMDQFLEGPSDSGDWFTGGVSVPNGDGTSTESFTGFYSHSESGGGTVEGTITLSTDGKGHFYETGNARATGDANTASGGSGANGFTQAFTGRGGGDAGLESQIRTYQGYCNDASTAASVGADITAAITGGEAGLGYTVLGNSVGAGMALNSAVDSMKTDNMLRGLIDGINRLKNSPCFAGLPDDVKASLTNEYNTFMHYANTARAWNAMNGAVKYGEVVVNAGGHLPGTESAKAVYTVGSWGLGKVSDEYVHSAVAQADLFVGLMQAQTAKHSVEDGVPDCFPVGDLFDPKFDPSGVVYEAVLSNPVEGAAVTLYSGGVDYTPEYADGVMVDLDGKPLTPENAGEAGSPTLTIPDDASIIPNSPVQTTGADGRYSWFVLEGLWYVTASKEGYQPANSENDVASVVTANGKNWLPVHPAQMNVNIPLVSMEAPVIKETRYESDGIYLTFSKYMDDTTLLADGAFQVNGVAATLTRADLINSEAAPDNIRYSGAAPTYTSIVRLPGKLYLRRRRDRQRKREELCRRTLCGSERSGPRCQSASGKRAHHHRPDRRLLLLGCDHQLQQQGSLRDLCSGSLRRRENEVSDHQNGNSRSRGRL